MPKTNPNAESNLPPSKKQCADASIFQHSLAVAAKFGYKEEFLSFLKKGAEVHVGETKNPYCGHNCEIETPIEKTIKANQHEITMILFENLDKSKVNLQCMLNRLLILAAQYARKITALELIKMGAELNPKCNDFKNCHHPLYLAACYKIDIEIVKILFQHGASINSKSCQHFSEPALYKACETGYTEMVSLLIENGADVNDVNMGERYGKTLIYATPLHYAAFFGHFEIVQILLENGARLCERNLLGETALCIAVKKGHCEMFKYLIQKGADANIWKGMQGPVMIAIIYSQMDGMKLLLKHGAEVNFQHFENQTPLQYAIKNQNLEIIHELLAHGANPNFLIQEDHMEEDHMEEPRFPALEQALKTGSLEIIKSLVKNGADEVCFTVWSMHFETL